MKTFRTPKGTELPIMDIKGKDYLQAAPRILWMREEHPDWSIETELLNFTEKQAVFKATIRDGSGKILSQATSMETLAGFDSFLEKAETCAVSRAAAFCGYGTLMAQELEEQDRKTARAKLAEAPVDPKPQAVVPKAPLPKPYRALRLRLRNHSRCRWLLSLALIQPSSRPLGRYRLLKDRPSHTTIRPIPTSIRRRSH